MQGLIQNCMDIGIHTFDHADIYGAYSTEKEFGNAIVDMKLNRENYQLISKCGIQYLCDNRDNTVKHYDYSKDYILWSVDQSLQNLRTDYLDLLLLHRPSPLMDPKEIAEVVELLKKKGKIKSFGVSNFSASQMDLIGLRTDVAVNQVEFSLSQFSAMHNGTFDYMISNGVGAMAWSPLGMIFKESNEQTQRVKEAMEPLKKKYNATADQLLLSWIMKHPAYVHPVIGTTRIDRLKRAKESEQITLDLEDWFLLLVASQGHKVP